MARVTVEDCLKNVRNRFELVIIAAKRARQLMRGKTAMVEWDNDKATVVALREIAAGHTDFDHKHEEELAALHKTETTPHQITPPAIVTIEEEEDDTDEATDTQPETPTDTADTTDTTDNQEPSTDEQQNIANQD